MQPTVDFDAAQLARLLLRRSRQGALATLMAGSGDPYCSLVNVASHPDGSPILLISRLALHTRNLLGDARVSLMLDERAEGDTLEGARIMLAGRAEQTRGRAPAKTASAVLRCRGRFTTETLAAGGTIRSWPNSLGLAISRSTRWTIFSCSIG